MLETLPRTLETDRRALARLDPRARLVCCLALVLALALTRDLLLLAVALLASLALAIGAGPRIQGAWRRLVHLEGFLLVLLVMLPLTVVGTPLFRVGLFEASVEGSLLALAIVLRVNACILVAMTFLAGLEPVRVGQALAAMGTPARLVHLFLFTIRYVSLTAAEANRLVEAMRARAFRPRVSLHSLRSVGHLAGMVFLRSIERAERIEEAMRCRGYRGVLPAGPVAALSLWDRMSIAAAVLLAAGLLGAGAFR